MELAHHRPELLIGSFSSHRLIAHYVPTKGAVPNEKARVDRDVAVEPIEVLAEGFPVPIHAAFERRERHAFDLRHHASEIVGVLGMQRR